VVWLATPRVNFLVETLWTGSQRVIAQGKTERSQDLYVSPGIRWAHNLNGRLQIVPGFAFPMGIGPCAGEKGVMFYLSFEHPWSIAHSKAR
jgi:hypothetical protein